MSQIFTEFPTGEGSFDPVWYRQSKRVELNQKLGSKGVKPSDDVLDHAVEHEMIIIKMANRPDVKGFEMN